MADMGPTELLATYLLGWEGLLLVIAGCHFPSQPKGRDFSSYSKGTVPELCEGTLA